MMQMPYMTCPGNHEWHYNFSNYKARFNMPGDENNNMFFSFDIGPVHFVSISTEFYYYLNYGMQQVIFELWSVYTVYYINGCCPLYIFLQEILIFPNL